MDEYHLTLARDLKLVNSGYVVAKTLQALGSYFYKSFMSMDPQMEVGSVGSSVSFPVCLSCFSFNLRGVSGRVEMTVQRDTQTLGVDTQIRFRTPHHVSQYEKASNFNVQNRGYWTTERDRVWKS